MKVREILFCRASDIVAVTSCGNEVTGITMREAGKWEAISGGGIFEQSFSQAVDFVKGKYIFIQNTLLASAKSDGNLEAYKTAQASCELVFVNYLENDGALIHGIELDIIASGGFTKSKISDARFGFKEMVLGLEGNLISKSTTLAPKMGLTKEQLLML